MTESLLHHIQRLVPGFAVPREQMAPFFQTRCVKKGELLLAENEPCHNLYFVNTGFLYLFYEHEGQKQVVHFAPENWWLTDYKTFSSGKPAGYAIEAIEDSEITSIHRKDYETLLGQFPLMALYFNGIHERAYGAALTKQKTFALTSKKDFYRYFLHTYPTLLPRIPDAVFASYMGVSPEMLRVLKTESVS